MMRPFVRGILSLAIGATLVVGSAAAYAQDQGDQTAPQDQPQEQPQQQPAVQGQVNVTVPQDTPPPAQQPVLVVPTPAETAAMTETDTETRVNTPLIATGIVTFGLSYGAAVLVASQSNRNGDNHLYVPVLGPWLDLANRGDCNVNNTSCDNETTNKVLLVTDGVFQAAGALTLIAGILMPTHEKVVRHRSHAQVLPGSLGPGTPGVLVVGSW